MKTKQTVNALIFSVVLFLIVHVFQSLEAAGNTPLGVNIDPLIRKGKVIQARVLMIIITIAVGSTVSNFFLDYLYYSRQLQNLFS
ncbi:DUF1146 domain-containing protein [Bacillus licheniformis]|nr:DUF1146 domain-containing protein [Bacillus licheniformis]